MARSQSSPHYAELAVSPGFARQPRVRYATDARLPDLAGAWGAMLALDTLIFVLTVARILQVSGALRSKLFRPMLRDGERPSSK